MRGAETAGDSLFGSFGNGGYDVRHYGLRVHWHPETSSITAVARLRLRTTQALSRLSLDLDGLRVTGVRVGGRPAEHSQAGHKLRVVPLRPLAAGRTVTVAVSYRGVPGPFTDPDGTSEGWMPTEDGAVALNQPVGALTWYPNNDTPSDKATYDVRVTVPAGLEAVSTGRLLSRTTRRGLTTWRWRTARPTPPELSMLAIGQFREHVGRTAAGLRTRSYTDVSVGTAAAARRQIGPVLDWLARRLGAYPFVVSGLLVDQYDAGYALETQTRPTFPGAVDDLTLVHELAHQWFGNSVTPADWGDIWLSEGWATYSEWQWTEREGGPTTARQFGAAYDRRSDRDDFWDIPPAVIPSAEDLYATPVYLRGAMTLEVLRQRIGDADFATLARRWVTEHRHGNVVTADFTALAEEVSGQELDTLFSDWLYTPERPEGY